MTDHVTYYYGSRANRRAHTDPKTAIRCAITDDSPCPNEHLLIDFYPAVARNTRRYGNEISYNAIMRQMTQDVDDNVLAYAHVIVDDASLTDNRPLPYDGRWRNNRRRSDDGSVSTFTEPLPEPKPQLGITDCQNHKIIISKGIRPYVLNTLHRRPARIRHKHNRSIRETTTHDVSSFSPHPPNTEYRPTHSKQSFIMC